MYDVLEDVSGLVFWSMVVTAAVIAGGSSRSRRQQRAACGSFYATDDSGMLVVAGPVIFAIRRDGAWENGPPELFPAATPQGRDSLPGDPDVPG